MATQEKSTAPTSGSSSSMQRLVLTQLCEQAAAATRAGRPEEAALYYQRALTLDSDNADLWALLGTVVQGDQARTACARQALARVPGHRLAQALLAGEAPPPGEPGNGGAAGPDLLPTFPDFAAPCSLPLAGAMEGPAGPPGPASVPGSSAASSKTIFRLSTPRLQPAVAQRRSPFWTTMALPRFDLRPLQRIFQAPRLAQAVRAARPAAVPGWTARARPRRSFRPTPQFRVRFAIVLALLLILGANAFLGALYEKRYAGRIIPGVRVSGLDVSGLAPAEAEHIFQDQVTATLDRPIQLGFAGQHWTFTAAEIGLRYLTSEAAQEAAGVGHRASFWESWRERLQAGLFGLDLSLQVEAQASRLQTVLDRVAADVVRPAIPPVVSWQDGNWSISPGQDGRHLVRDEAEDRLLTALAGVAHGDTPVLVVLPVVTDSAALAEADFIRLRSELDQVAQPLTVRCDDHTWELVTSDIAAWLRVKLAPPAIEVDRAMLQAFLTALAPEVALPVRLPRMEVVDGRVTVFQAGSDGRSLDLETSRARLEDALQRRLRGEPVEAVDLLTQVVPAGQDALMAEMGVMELIGEGHSSFSGSSWARITNIVVGGQDLNGRLVPPGEVFSFNEAVDPVTWEKGYVMSEIINAGQVGWGMGGGLCQVATTVYRAVLHTGLEVVERHPHAWRLSWYEQDSPPGFDATIMLGGPDLKFRNNTGHYILIQVETSAEETWQRVLIYGTSPSWQVTISEPARDNYGLYFRRTVTAADGQVLIDETVYSNY